MIEDDGGCLNTCALMTSIPNFKLPCCEGHCGFVSLVSCFTKIDGLNQRPSVPQAASRMIALTSVNCLLTGLVGKQPVDCQHQHREEVCHVCEVALKAGGGERSRGRGCALR